MSLLMQALKKAQRNQSGAPPGDDDLAFQSGTVDDVVALTPDDVLAGRVPPTTTLPLEPLEETSVSQPAGSVNEQVPALEAALPAPHDPTPPQSRRQAAAPAMDFPQLGAAGLPQPQDAPLDQPPALRELTLADLAPPESMTTAPALAPGLEAAAALSTIALMPLADMQPALAGQPATADQSPGAPLDPLPGATIDPFREAHEAYASPDTAPASPRSSPGRSALGGAAAASPAATHRGQESFDGQSGSSGLSELSGLSAQSAQSAQLGLSGQQGQSGEPAPSAPTGSAGKASSADHAGNARRPGTAHAHATPGPAARARAAAQAAAEQDQPRRDPARVRLAVLGAALALVAGTLAGVYWHALTSPGAGASLPPVPMPPPGTGKTAPPATVVSPASDQPGAAAGVAAPAGAPPDTLPGAPLQASQASQTAQPSQAWHPATGYTGQPSTPGSPQAGSRMPADDDLQRALQGQPRAATRNDPAPAAPGAMPAAPQSTASNTPQPAPAPVHAPQTATTASGAVDIHLQRGAAPLRIATALQDGYQAFLNGDYTTAAQHYAAALRQDPNSRDALLGNAAIAVRRNDIAAATSGYQRLLELNPSDADAQAGLLALRPGDAAHSEMRLRDMLRRDPGAAPLEFALGNLYAQQGRWPDAQQAYFRAYSAMPDNADYAFNLAVGLDRLSRRKLALTYYQRALELSRNSPAAFDRNAARLRAGQLGDSADGQKP